MSNAYHHTQRGTVLMVLCAIPALMIVGMLVFVASQTPLESVPGGFLPIMLIGLALTVIVAVLFSSMTIHVDQSALTLSYALGFPRVSIPLQDIESAQAVRNSWAYGWGIRLTPRGMLYNVSGLDSVEVTLKNGKHIGLGTDEPRALLTALQDRHIQAA